MASLADVARRTETVVLRGQEYKVVGIDWGQVFPLLERFPDKLGQVLLGGATMDAQALAGELANAKAFVGAFLAAGCGEGGHEPAEQGALNLSLAEQAALAAAIVRCTMEGGPGPFVELLRSIGVAVNVGPTATPVQPLQPQRMTPPQAPQPQLGPDGRAAMGKIRSISSSRAASAA